VDDPLTAHDKDMCPTMLKWCREAIEDLKEQTKIVGTSNGSAIANPIVWFTVNDSKTRGLPGCDRVFHKLSTREVAKSPGQPFSGLA
jgi:hypothetical protein